MLVCGLICLLYLDRYMYSLTRKVIVKLTVGLSIIFIQSINLKNPLLAAEIEASKNISTFNIDDTVKYNQIVNYAKKNNLTSKEIGKIVQSVAQQFLGTEYQAGLLDRSTQENLVVSLQQFDCLLFVETVLAIADNIVQQQYSEQDFANKIENKRYWNGRINGYCSRLHYFSDWIEDNQTRGNVENITRKLGGINTTKKLNFMTTHRSSYPNLAKSDLNFKCIAGVEATLSTNFNYIPTKNIQLIYSQLQPGDIVGVATNIAGLDFTHTGFVYRQPDGSISFIHASPAGKVTIAKDLQKYVANVKNAIGIVVSRASEPKLR